MEPIDIDAIQRHFKHLKCNYVDSIASTQSAVKSGELLIAEAQTAGIGRRGNQWLAPKGRSISLSCRFELAVPLEAMPGYQLTTALAVMLAIKSFDPEAQVQLKWPNDLYHQQKKFAGILINLIPQQKHRTEVIVGVGINWQLTNQQLKAINRPITNVPVNKITDRSTFVISLIENIQRQNNLFVEAGLKPALDGWQEHDLLLGKQVTLMGPEQQQTGKYLGLNNSGELLLQSSNGIQSFSSGEVSVKTV